MQYLVYGLIVFVTFWVMEFMAWFTHKYVMHGFLWSLHRGHHQGEKTWIHRNDTFFLIFALPSWLCIMLGMMQGNYFSVSVGVGIAVYGFIYFLIHEVYIHQRWRLFRKSNSFYFRAIKRAHAAHHNYLEKHPGVAYGLLVVPKKFFAEEKRKMAKRAQVRKSTKNT